MKRYLGGTTQRSCVSLAGNHWLAGPTTTTQLHCPILTVVTLAASRVTLERTIVTDVASFFSYISSDTLLVQVHLPTTRLSSGFARLT